MDIDLPRRIGRGADASSHAHSVIHSRFPPRTSAPPRLCGSTALEIETNMPALTPSQTIGPFFLEGFRWALELAAPPAAGVRVSGRVLDRDGKGVSDALIEIWQPDWPAQQALAGWQRVATDDEGRFAFAMPKPENGQVHANVTVFARGLLREVFTRVYLHPADDVARAGPARRCAAGAPRHARRQAHRGRRLRLGRAPAGRGRDGVLRDLAVSPQRCASRPGANP